MKTFRPGDLLSYRISPGDTTRLVVLASPADGVAHSLFLEIWEPGGSQPPNTHPDSVETFVFLAGSGVAHCDGVSTPVAAGDVIVLPATSVHQVVNLGAERMYSITLMTPDDGFADLVRSGEPVPLDEDDLAVLRRHRPGEPVEVAQ